MDRMRSHWRQYFLIVVVAVLTVTSFATLVHRHANGGDPGCVLCHGRQETGIDYPIANVLPTPVVAEEATIVVEVQLVSEHHVPVQSGRAPPASF